MLYAIPVLIVLVVVIVGGGRTLWRLMGRRWSWPRRNWDDDED
jgi:hypothetical protein